MLTPLSDSEISSFNYTNALAAERSYLLEDAHPDWKHKARLISSYLLSSGALNSYANISKWMTQLRQAESRWIQFARDSQVPDFEGTVLEYESSVSESGSVTSTPSESSFSEDEVWDVPVAATRKLPEAVQREIAVGVGVG